MAGWLSLIFKFKTLGGTNQMVPAMNNGLWTVLGDFFVGLGSMFLNGLATVFYVIARFVLNIIDFLQFLVQKLAGLDVWMKTTEISDLKNLKESDVVFRFLLSDTVTGIFKTMITIFFVLLLLFTIIAIIKNEYGNAVNGESNDHKKSIYTALKAIVSVFLVPIILIGGILTSNAILAGLAKSFNIGTNLSMGGQIFVASAYDASNYRQYANSGVRKYAGNTCVFEIPIRMATGSLTNSEIANGYYVCGDYVVKKVKVSTALPLVNPMKTNNFAGFMFTLNNSNFVSNDTYFLWSCAESEKENYYYYIKYVLGGYIVEQNVGKRTNGEMVYGFYRDNYNYYLDQDTSQANEIKVSNMYTSLADSMGEKLDTNGFMHGENLDELHMSNVLIKAAYNTWQYNEVLTKDHAGWNDKATLNSETVTGVVTKSGAFVTVNRYTNDPYWACYHDGGRNGLVALPVEYLAMADIIDFIIENGVTLYFVNANNSNIRWQNMMGNTEYSYTQYTTGASGQIDSLLVDYSKEGKVQYQFDSTANSEMYGATYIMCWYSAANGGYIPVANNIRYTDDNGNAYNFKSSQYAEHYHGAVIARGLFQSNNYTKNYMPTYINSTMVGGVAGSDFDSARKVMAKMKIQRTEYTALQQLTNGTTNGIATNQTAQEGTIYISSRGSKADVTYYSSDANITSKLGNANSDVIKFITENLYADGETIDKAEYATIVFDEYGNSLYKYMVTFASGRVTTFTLQNTEILGPNTYLDVSGNSSSLYAHKIEFVPDDSSVSIKSSVPTYVGIYSGNTVEWGINATSGQDLLGDVTLTATNSMYNNIFASGGYDENSDADISAIANLIGASAAAITDSEGSDYYFYTPSGQLMDANQIGSLQIGFAGSGKNIIVGQDDAGRLTVSFGLANGAVGGDILNYSSHFYNVFVTVNNKTFDAAAGVCTLLASVVISGSTGVNINDNNNVIAQYNTLITSDYGMAFYGYEYSFSAENYDETFAIIKNKMLSSFRYNSADGQTWTLLADASSVTQIGTSSSGAPNLAVNLKFENSVGNRFNVRSTIVFTEAQETNLNSPVAIPDSEGNFYRIIKYNYTIGSYTVSNSYNIVVLSYADKPISINNDDSMRADSDGNYSAPVVRIVNSSPITANELLFSGSFRKKLDQPDGSTESITVYRYYYGVESDLLTGNAANYYVNGVASNNSKVDHGVNFVTVGTADQELKRGDSVSVNPIIYSGTSYNAQFAADIIAKDTVITAVTAPSYTYYDTETSTFSIVDTENTLGNYAWVYSVSVKRDNSNDANPYYLDYGVNEDGTYTYNNVKIRLYKIQSNDDSNRFVEANSEGVFEVEGNQYSQTISNAGDYLRERLTLQNLRVNTRDFSSTANINGVFVTTLHNSDLSTIVLNSESAAPTDTSIYVPTHLLNTLISTSIGPIGYDEVVPSSTAETELKTIKRLVNNPTAITFNRDQLTKSSLPFDFSIAIFAFGQENSFRFRLHAVFSVEQTNTFGKDYVALNLAGGATNLDYNFENTVKIGNVYQVVSLQWIILLFAIILITSILGKAVWGLIRRIYEITLLFLIMPAVASTTPLDPKGSRFSKWREQIIGQVLGAYGVTLGLNFFFIIIPVIRTSSAIFTDADVANLSSTLRFFAGSADRLNYLTYVLFLLVAFTLLNTVPKMIATLVYEKGAGADVISQGEQTVKGVTETVKNAGDTLSGQKLKQAMETGGELLFGKKDDKTGVRVGGMFNIPGSAIYNDYKKKKMAKAGKEKEEHARGAERAAEASDANAADAAERAKAAMEAAQNRQAVANNPADAVGGEETASNEAVAAAEAPQDLESNYGDVLDALDGSGAADELAEAVADNDAVGEAVQEAAEGSLESTLISDDKIAGISEALKGKFNAYDYNNKTGAGQLRDNASEAAVALGKELGLSDEEAEGIRGTIQSAEINKTKGGRLHSGELNNVAAQAVIEAANQHNSAIQQKYDTAAAEAAENALEQNLEAVDGPSNAERAEQAQKAAEADKLSEEGKQDVQQAADSASNEAQAWAEASKAYAEVSQAAAESTKIRGDIASGNVDDYERITDKQLKEEAKLGKLKDKAEDAAAAEEAGNGKRSRTLNAKDISEWNKAHPELAIHDKDAREIAEADYRARGDKEGLANYRKEQDIRRNMARQDKYTSNLAKKVARQEGIVDDASRGIYRGVRGFVKRTFFSGEKTTEQRLRDDKRRQNLKDISDKITSGEINSWSEVKSYIKDNKISRLQTSGINSATRRAYKNFFKDRSNIKAAAAIDKALVRAENRQTDNRSGLLHQAAKLPKNLGRLVAYKAGSLGGKVFYGISDKMRGFMDGKRAAKAERINKNVEAIDKLLGRKNSFVFKSDLNGLEFDKATKKLVDKYMTTKKISPQQLDEALKKRRAQLTGGVYQGADGKSYTKVISDGTRKRAKVAGRVISDIFTLGTAEAVRAGIRKHNYNTSVRREATEAMKQAGNGFAKKFGKELTAQRDMRSAAGYNAAAISQQRQEQQYRRMLDRLQNSLDFGKFLTGTGREKLRNLLENEVIKNAKTLKEVMDSTDLSESMKRQLNHFLNRKSAHAKGGAKVFEKRAAAAASVLNARTVNSQYKKAVDDAVKDAVKKMGASSELGSKINKAAQDAVKKNMTPHELNKYIKDVLKRELNSKGSGIGGMSEAQYKQILSALEKLKKADRTYTRSLRTLQESNRKLTKQLKDQKSKSALSQSTKGGGSFGDNASGK